MLGVFKSDDHGSSVTKFLFHDSYDNAFIIDPSRRVDFEIDSFSWRRMLAVDNDDTAPLSTLRSRYVAAQRRLRCEAAAHRRQLASTMIDAVFEDGDSSGRLMGTRVVRRSIKPANAVGLIMAGGFGRRLGELTRHTPKPMLDLGGKPICAHLADNFLRSGISDLFFSVHYLPHVVKEYFGSGAEMGARIEYLEETKPLGTAGCLSFLPNDLDRPVVMVNGDVVTGVKFSRLLEFHERSGLDVTVSVRPDHVQIPFGVVEQRDGKLLRIREKPRYDYSINVAIYVLSPRVLREIGPGEHIDMPALVERLLTRGYTVGVFPLVEKWVDVGTIADLQRARAEYRVPSTIAPAYLRSQGVLESEQWQASA